MEKKIKRGRIFNHRDGIAELKKFQKELKEKPKFIPNTPEERIEFLRNAIRQATESHGVPCCCMLCEALIFDCLAKEGKVNVVTGERNPPLEA